MTAREQVTVQEVNRKLDNFIGEFRSWKKDFVQPLVTEKEQRLAAEKQLKVWGKWVSVALGVIVSLSILIRNILGR